MLRSSPHHKNALLQLSGDQPVACRSLALSRDARFLLTATDRAIKVWDYSMQAGPSYQVCATGGPRWAGERVEDNPLGLIPHAR